MASEWKISGRFTAGGAAFESEIWAPLADLQAALKRQDVSLVAVGLARGRLAGRCRTVLQRAVRPGTAGHRRNDLLRLAAKALPAGADARLGRRAAWWPAPASSPASTRCTERSWAASANFRRCKPSAFAGASIAISLIQEATLLSMAASLLAAAVALLSGQRHRRPLHDGCICPARGQRGDPGRLRHWVAAGLGRRDSAGDQGDALSESSRV